MKFVLDTSVTLTWAFPDESSPIARRAEEVLQTSGGGAVVPALWWYEVRNILLVNERRGRITAMETAIFLSQMAAVPISVVSPPDDGILLDLARQTRLTIYDASYLALAMQHGLPLATLDQALQSAAQSMKVALLY